MQEKGLGPRFHYIFKDSDQVDSVHRLDDFKSMAQAKISKDPAARNWYKNSNSISVTRGRILPSSKTGFDIGAENIENDARLS